MADAGGTYNGSAFAATATVAGVLAGVDSTPAATLEGVVPTLSYYGGSQGGRPAATDPALVWWPARRGQARRGVRSGVPVGASLHIATHAARAVRGGGCGVR